MDKVSLTPVSMSRFTDMLKSNNKLSDKLDGADKKQSFGEVLSSSLREVNGVQQSADMEVQKFLSGQNSGIHETMIALEKADLSVRLLVQVRNKAVEAYREIMKMQV